MDVEEGEVVDPNAKPPIQLLFPKRHTFLEVHNRDFSPKRKGAKGFHHEHFFNPTSHISLYEKLEKIGEGTFGEVYRGQHRVTKQMVALKKLLLKNEKEGFPITALREIKLLRQIHSLHPIPNAINLVDIAHARGSSEPSEMKSIYMIFPYMDYDLTGLLDSHEIPITIPMIKCMMQQLLQGIRDLHSRNIIHRDLKASNILLNSDGIIKIADFGLARPFDAVRKDYTPGVVTRWYRPPELLLGTTNYTTAIDMWSAGCIFAELFVREPFLNGKSDLDQLNQITKYCGPINPSTLPGCEKLSDYSKLDLGGGSNKLKEEFVKYDHMAADLLSRLLVIDPAKRLSAAEALEHRFFSSVPLPARLDELPKGPSVHEYDRRRAKESQRGAVPLHAKPREYVGMGGGGQPDSFSHHGRRQPFY